MASGGTSCGQLRSDRVAAAGPVMMVMVVMGDGQGRPYYSVIGGGRRPKGMVGMRPGLLARWGPRLCQAAKNHLGWRGRGTLWRGPGTEAPGVVGSGRCGSPPGEAPLSRREGAGGKEQEGGIDSRIAGGGRAGGVRGCERRRERRRERRKARRKVQSANLVASTAKALLIFPGDGRGSRYC